MLAAIVYQLTRNPTPEQIKEGGFDAYFVDHTTGIYPQFASGTPWSAMSCISSGLATLSESFKIIWTQKTIMRSIRLSAFVPLKNRGRRRSPAWTAAI